MLLTLWTLHVSEQGPINSELRKNTLDHTRTSCLPACMLVVSSSLGRRLDSQSTALQTALVANSMMPARYLVL